MTSISKNSHIEELLPESSTSSSPSPSKTAACHSHINNELIMERENETAVTRLQYENQRMTSLVTTLEELNVNAVQSNNRTTDHENAILRKALAPTKGKTKSKSMSMHKKKSANIDSVINNSNATIITTSTPTPTTPTDTKLSSHVEKGKEKEKEREKLCDSRDKYNMEASNGKGRDEDALATNANIEEHVDNDQSMNHKLVVGVSAAVAAATASKQTESESECKVNVAPTTTLDRLDNIYDCVMEICHKIRLAIAGIGDGLYQTQMMKVINRYKVCCTEAFQQDIVSLSKCRKLSKNMLHMLNLFNSLCGDFSDSSEYTQSICELLALYITVELRICKESKDDKILITNRIVYLMRHYLANADMARMQINCLCVLIRIANTYGEKEIVTTVFEEFIPRDRLVVQKELPDKLYMQYIIVFYRWMQLEADTASQMRIIEFAEKFMRPSMTLCNNPVYAYNLARYHTNSTATRTILHNMKFFQDLRNASIRDNSLAAISDVVNLCDDEEDGHSGAIDFNSVFVTIDTTTTTTWNSCSTNIKGETLETVDTVDLTVDDDEDDEENIEDNIVAYLSDEEEWLKKLRKCAQRCDILRHNVPLVRNTLASSTTQCIIELDSDTESEGEKQGTKATFSTTKTSSTQSHEPESLFSLNFPENSSSLADIGEDQDDDNATTISLRLPSDSLRTYTTKKTKSKYPEEINLKPPYVATTPKITDARSLQETMLSSFAYRRDSFHIQSSPRVMREDDTETELQDEQDSNDLFTYDMFPIAKTTSKAKKSTPYKSSTVHGPYPTYNSTADPNRVLFSLEMPRFPFRNNDRQKQFGNTEHKKQVKFCENPIGPNSTYAGLKAPFKPTLQSSKKPNTSQISTAAPSIVGSSTSTSISTMSGHSNIGLRDRHQENQNINNNEIAKRSVSETVCQSVGSSDETVSKSSSEQTSIHTNDMILTTTITTTTTNTDKQDCKLTASTDDQTNQTDPKNNKNDKVIKLNDTKVPVNETGLNAKLIENSEGMNVVVKPLKQTTTKEIVDVEKKVEKKIIGDNNICREDKEENSKMLICAKILTKDDEERHQGVLESKVLAVGEKGEVDKIQNSPNAVLEETNAGKTEKSGNLEKVNAVQSDTSDSSAENENLSPPTTELSKNLQGKDDGVDKNKKNANDFSDDCSSKTTNAKTDMSLSTLNENFNAKYNQMSTPSIDDVITTQPLPSVNDLNKKIKLNFNKPKENVTVKQAATPGKQLIINKSQKISMARKKSFFHKHNQIARSIKETKTLLRMLKDAKDSIPEHIIPKLIIKRKQSADNDKQPQFEITCRDKNVKIDNRKDLMPLTIKKSSKIDEKSTSVATKAEKNKGKVLCEKSAAMVRKVLSVVEKKEEEGGSPKELGKSSIDSKLKEPQHSEEERNGNAVKDNVAKQPEKDVNLQTKENISSKENCQVNKEPPVGTKATERDLINPDIILPSTSQQALSTVVESQKKKTETAQSKRRVVQIVTPQRQISTTSAAAFNNENCEGGRPLRSPPLESYPATPMLSVANVEKLMNFSRFIDKLMASLDVAAIIASANVIGCYAEGQRFEMERTAILEHYNIANANGQTQSNALFWKTGKEDTISIFNDNDNEWITLPPSTAKQLQKLSFVLAILQEQYQVDGKRQRINIALTHLINKSNSTNVENTTSLTFGEQQFEEEQQPLEEHNQQQTQIMANNLMLQASPVNDATASMSPNVAWEQTPSPQHFVTVVTENTPSTRPIPNLGGATYRMTENNNQTIEKLRFNNNPSTTLLNCVNNNKWPAALSCHNINTANHVPYAESAAEVPAHDNTANLWDDLTANEQIFLEQPCLNSPQSEVVLTPSGTQLTNELQLSQVPQNPKNIIVPNPDETLMTQENNSLSHTLSSSLSRDDRGYELQTKKPYTTDSNSMSAIFNTHFGKLNRNVVLQNPYMQQNTASSVQLQPSLNPYNNNQNGSTANMFNDTRAASQSQQSQLHYRNRFSPAFTTSRQQDACQASSSSSSSSSGVNHKSGLNFLQQYVVQMKENQRFYDEHISQIKANIESSQQYLNTVPGGLGMLSHGCPYDNRMAGIRTSPNTPTTSGALEVVTSFIEQSQAYTNEAQLKRQQNQLINNHNSGVDKCYQQQQQQSQEPPQLILKDHSTAMMNAVPSISDGAGGQQLEQISSSSSLSTNIVIRNEVQSRKRSRDHVVIYQEKEEETPRALNMAPKKQKKNDFQRTKSCDQVKLLQQQQQLHHHHHQINMQKYNEINGNKKGHPKPVAGEDPKRQCILRNIKNTINPPDGRNNPKQLSTRIKSSTLHKPVVDCQARTATALNPQASVYNTRQAAREASKRIRSVFTAK